MKILAIDTSGQACSAAVWAEGKVLCEQYLNYKLTHSVQLMKLIDNCLDLTDLKIADFDAFAVAAGPGSFTGLRIGICAVKGFAQLTDKPCIKVDTLDAIACASGAGGVVVPIIDARRKTVFTAIYNNGVKQTEDDCLNINDLLAKLNGEVTFAGDGVDSFMEIIKQALPNARFAGENVRYQRAGAVAALAVKLFNEGKTVSCFELMPEYLKETQAERERAERLNNA